MIPKKIHYCWFGHGEKPDLLLRCMESWEKYCPGYEITEWNEGNYDVRGSLYTRLAYGQGKWAHVSDYARIDIVNRHGGIYLDTDVELLKSLDPLLKNRLYFGIEQGSLKVNSGLGFGAGAGHGFLRRLLRGYDALAEKISRQEAGFVPCPTMETALLRAYGFCRRDAGQKLAGGIRAYPSGYFCPKAMDGRMEGLSAHTYSIHHYQGSWLGGQGRDSRYLVKLKFSRQLELLRGIMVWAMGERRFRRWRAQAAGQGRAGVPPRQGEAARELELGQGQPQDIDMERNRGSKAMRPENP